MHGTWWVLAAAILALTLSGGISTGRADDDTDDAALARAHELNENVVKLWRAGNFAEAEPLAREALAIWERVHGSDHPETSHGLRQLGAQLLGLRRYDEARRTYARSMRIRAALHGDEHPEVARDLVTLAMAEEGRQQLETAVGHLDRALAIYEARGGAGDPGATNVARRAGWLLRRMGRFEEASRHLERALAGYEARLGPEHPRIAGILNALSGVDAALGHYEIAEKRSKRAIAISEKAYGPEDPRVAHALSGLGLMYLDRGAFEEAEPLFQRALDIYERAADGEPTNVARALSNLAALHWRRGRYESARVLNERALALRQEHLGADHAEVAESLNNLAALLMDLGQWEATLPLCERAIETWTHVYGAKHPHLVAAYGNQARALELLGRLEAAEGSFRRALALSEGIWGKEHAEVALSLNNLAALLETRGKLKEACGLHERALRIREQVLGPEHPDLAQSLGNLAGVLAQLGEHDRASSMHERSLAILTKVMGPEHPSVLAGLQSHATLLWEQGRRDVATRNLLDVLDRVERRVRRDFAALEPAARRRLFRHLRHHLDSWVNSCQAVSRTGYEEVLRLKGLVARASAAERLVARHGGEEARASLRRLQIAERQVSRLANAVPPSFQRETHARWEREYAEATANREQSALAFARGTSSLRLDPEQKGRGLEAVQRRLEDGSVLVDFLRTDKRYVAWVVHPEGDVVRVDLAEVGLLEAAAEAFTERVGHRASEGDAWRAAGRRLAALLLDPLAPHLGEALQTLYVSPDAALAVVPFAALAAEAPRASLKDVRWTHVSMAQDLLPPTRSIPPGQGALVVGDVDYGSASEWKERPIGARPRVLAELDRAPRGGTFVRLPATGAEVDAVRRLLGEDCAVLRGTQATESRLHAAAKGRRVLHLATHGFVRDDLLRGLGACQRERQLAAGHDPMMLAGLALAGANPRDGGHGDDGIFTAAEASYLDLEGTELVVLSACETARGRAASGNGVIGLIRAFQMAGARQVLGSLWMVDDAATSALMTSFHRHWSGADGQEGLPAAEALRLAQAEVRAREAWRHPFYWAAWILWDSNPADS